MAKNGLQQLEHAHVELDVRSAATIKFLLVSTIWHQRTPKSPPRHMAGTQHRYINFQIKKEIGNAQKAIASAVAVDGAGRRTTRRQEFSRELFCQILCQSDVRNSYVRQPDLRQPDLR
jgi:hypothetical protein